MDDDPLMPLGNSIRNNILIGCEKPFALAKGVDEQWLDKENNAEWGLEDFPSLPQAGSTGKRDLSKLPAIWQKVTGFEPIPIEIIGLAGLSGAARAP
jgi:hypothetical protein